MKRRPRLEYDHFMAGLRALPGEPKWNDCIKRRRAYHRAYWQQRRSPQK